MTVRTYDLYNYWISLEFSALDNVVRFHGFITFIVDTNECKAFKNLPLLILTWRSSFCSKDLIQFEPHSLNLRFIAVSIPFLLTHSSIMRKSLSWEQQLKRSISYLMGQKIIQKCSSHPNQSIISLRSSYILNILCIFSFSRYLTDSFTRYKKET